MYIKIAAQFHLLFLVSKIGVKGRKIVRNDYIIIQKQI